MVRTEGSAQGSDLGLTRGATLPFFCFTFSTFSSDALSLRRGHRSLLYAMKENKIELDRTRNEPSDLIQTPRVRWVGHEIESKCLLYEMKGNKIEVDRTSILIQTPC